MTIAGEIEGGFVEPDRVEGPGPFGRGLAGRLLDALPDPAYFLDPGGRALLWNEAAARFTGYPREDMLAPFGSVEKLAYSDWSDVPLRWEELPSSRSLIEGRSVDRLLFVRRRESRQVWVEVRCSPVRGDDGAILGVLVVLRDATPAIAVEEALHQARRAAESDPLTGLANRRSLDRMLELHLGIQAREDRPLCLLMADLDHFKDVNDGWGHDVGDRALTAFAGVLQGLSRAEDLAARLGGDEFVILLPDHSLDVAARIAERIRVATPDATPPELGRRRLTASFGVAQAARDESAAQLIRRADAALYRAKALGRDRVEVDEADA
ncbi:sensor domain-containing diguanylate cyclase [Paludisphaera mucosa]|uniref:diguanylate cyclase n=1 Tax=Paludisphaera mucosa TaxID=3030827 RepID=A0ABT6FEW3_9BACT|nr:diguanylate cyclase [Paludisphaera mucosa]MDG3006062.1 diguanylate cyclase [Paludisphaera mucosa]